jgi:hypothetical protein
MPQGVQALLALLILLPGFVSARIARMMSARSQMSELERVTEALIFSFFTYVIYLLLFGPHLPLEWRTDPTASGRYSFEVFRARVFFLGAFSVLLGFGWGYIKGHDLLLKLLRKWKMTERTSRESVWNDAFVSLGGTVQVGLADGTSAIGWLGRYSDTGEERALFLERASWIAESGALTPVPGAGLLLTEKSEIKYVMFLDGAQK